MFRGKNGVMGLAGRESLSLPPFGDMQFPGSTRNKSRPNEELDRRLGFVKDDGTGDGNREDQDGKQMAEADTEQQRVISINVAGHMSRQEARESNGLQTERTHHSNSLHQNRVEAAGGGQTDARSVHFSPEIRMAIENQLDPSQNHR